jgi:hypothetical protein
MSKAFVFVPVIFCWGWSTTDFKISFLVIAYDNTDITIGTFVGTAFMLTFVILDPLLGMKAARSRRE